MPTFRPATLDDAATVAHVYCTSFNYFISFAPSIENDVGLDMWIRLKLLPSTHVTLVEQEGATVGIIATATKWYPAGNRHIGWIDLLYLLPNAVGHGIGSALVEQAKAELGSPIRLYTFQENHGARRFYERHGFSAIAERDGSSNQEGCPDVLYEWRAPPPRLENAAGA